MLAIDTSAVIGLFERQDASVVELLTEQVEAAIRLDVVEAELLHEVEMSDDLVDMRRRTLRAYRDFTVDPDPVPARSTVIELYAHVSAQASRIENRSGQNDRWIIAEAVAAGVTTFVTQDATQSELIEKWCEVTGRTISTPLC